MTTTIKVLEDRAIEIKNALDTLSTVVGTGIYVIERPIWDRLGYVHCETLITQDAAKYNLHEVSAFLRDQFNIQAHLTAGKWCRWEWAIYSTSALEYEVKS